MIADRLFEPGTVPEWTTPEWYQGREVAPHLEQEGHRERLELAVQYLRPYLRGHTVSDLGAGDGGLLSMVQKGALAVWGYDLAPVNQAAAAARGVKVETLDVIKDWDRVILGDIVIATELLEHLIDPLDLLCRVHTSNAQYLLASSPYTETRESHYEFHTYAWDREGYYALLRAGGWLPITAGTAWISQVVLCTRS